MNEEHEVRLMALRETLNASIAAGGAFTSEEVLAAVAKRLDDRERDKSLQDAFPRRRPGPSRHQFEKAGRRR